MKYKMHTLKNGLRIVLVPQPYATTATTLVLTGTGSRYEDSRTNGISHFLEHMFFKGTKKRKTAMAIANELDSIGGEYNAFTSKDHTAYYAKVAPEHIGVVLDVVADIFLNSTLPAREIEKERGAIIEEINMYEDMPMRKVYDVFEELIFGKDHPLGWDIAGPKRNVLTLKRKDFVDYLNSNYTAKNTVVCVAGKFSNNKVLKELRGKFGKMNGRSIPTSKPCLDVEQEPRVAIKYKETDQTHLMLGVPAYEYNHKDENALIVLDSVLGGGMSSRLWNEVREKRGLAYYVKSSAERYTDTGYLSVRAGVTHKNLPKAVKIILQELRKIKNKPVATKELKKAKEHLKGTLALSLDTSDHVAGYFAANTVLRGKAASPQVVAKNIDKVSAKDVQRVAKDILGTARLNLAVVGPHKNEGALLKLLKI